MARTDLEIVSEWRDSVQDAAQCWDPYLQQAYRDLNFKTGKQYSEDELAYLRKQGRTPLVYNKILRVVNNITGYQRRNRLGLACEPQEGSDLETSDIFSDLLTWNMQAQNGYSTVSSAFKGAVITGLNLLDTWMDYSEDREYGDIRITREPYSSFLLDPFWSGDPSLRDCRYVTRRRYVTKEEAMSLLPEAKSDIKKLHGVQGAGDGLYTYMAYSKKSVGKLLSYDEFFIQRMKPAFLMVNRLTDESRIFNGSKRALNAFLDSPASVQVPTGQTLEIPFRAFTDISSIMVKAVELNVIVEGELMYSGKQNSGLEDFPFIPVVGYYEPEQDDYAYKLQGVVRCMRDPQTDLNRQRSKILDMINSKASTGWIYKQGTVINTNDLFKTGQGVQIVTSKEAQPGDLQQIQAGDIPSGNFNYTQIVDKEINEIPGVTDENLGLIDSGSQISGTTTKLRQASGTTTLSEFFDNLDLSQKVLGQKQIKLMQLNWGTEKVERITGRTATKEFLEEENFGKYDCIVKETNLTDSQRTLGYMQGLQALQAGVQIPQKFLIEEMPIADKSKLLKAFEEEQEETKQQEAKIAEAEELQKALANSKIVSDLSLAAERRSRMVADEALARERLSQADLDRAKAVTEQIKAGKEIQEADLNLLIKALSFTQQMTQQMRDQNKEDVVESSRRAMTQVLVSSQADLSDTEPNIPIPTEQQIVGG